MDTIRLKVDPATIATKLVDPIGRFWRQPALNHRALVALRQLVDSYSQSPNYTQAVLKVPGPPESMFDLGKTGGRHPRSTRDPRPPGGTAVVIEVDYWPPSRARITVTHDRTLHSGLDIHHPSVAEISNGGMSRHYYYNGHEITKGMLEPAPTFAEVAGWGGKIASFAAPEHPRLMEVVATAESLGIPVAAMHESFEGIILYSPGNGQPYGLVERDAYRATLGARRASGKGALVLSSSYDGISWMAKLHGINWTAPLEGTAATAIPVQVKSKTIGGEVVELSEKWADGVAEADTPSAGIGPR